MKNVDFLCVVLRIEDLILKEFINLVIVKNLWIFLLLIEEYECVYKHIWVNR